MTVLTVEGPFTGTYTTHTFVYNEPAGTGTVFYAAGGTDTLDLNLDRSAIASLDGQPLAQFNQNIHDSITSQAIYHGSAYDYLRLTDGREIYFQGIDTLQFLFGDTLQLQVLPSENVQPPNQPSQIRDITQMSGDETNGQIAVNPMNPTQLFMASESSTHRGLVVATSTDGGNTWTTSIMFDGTTRDAVTNEFLPTAYGQPSVAWDGFGNLFLIYMDGPLEAALLESSDGGNSFALRTQNASFTVSLGTATGGTFTLSYAEESTDPITYSPSLTAAAVKDALVKVLMLFGAGENDVAVTGPNGGPYQVTFQNMLGGTPELFSGSGDELSGGTLTVTPTAIGGPDIWLASDLPKVAVGGNSVWVSWTKGNVIDATGAAVTGPLAANSPLVFVPPSDIPLPHLPPHILPDYSNIAVGPSGQVLVSFQDTNPADPAAIYTSLNSSGLGALPLGATNRFATAIVAANTHVNPNYSIPALPTGPNPTTPPFGINAGGQVAFDPSGRAYVVYVNNTSIGTTSPHPNDTDIFVKTSTNGGQTWTSMPVVVNDDSTFNSQVWPSIAVDPTTGHIGVFWYDDSNDPNQVLLQPYAAVSSDGGQTFGRNIQISTGYTNGVGHTFGVGLYSGLAFYGGILHPVWADNSNSTAANTPPMINPDGAVQDWTSIRLRFRRTRRPFSGLRPSPPSGTSSSPACPMPGASPPAPAMCSSSPSTPASRRCPRERAATI